MAFRVVEQLIPQFDNAGAVLADGTLTFSLTGTATAASVWTNPGLSIACANPLGLDSAGRPDTDCWAGVPLRVVVKDADGNVIRTLDNVQAPSSDETTLPAFEDGKFLSNDGAVASWETIVQVPDPTGSEGKYLGVAGGVAAWQAFEEQVFDADNLPGGVEETPGASGNVVIGNTRIQWGVDTCPTAGALNTTKAVTFGVAFSAAPHVILVTAKSTSVTSNSPSGSPSMQAINYSTTGFTANAFVGEENTGGTDVINSTITFAYVAIGPV